jgi:hypothetical protein
MTNSCPFAAQAIYVHYASLVNCLSTLISNFVQKIFWCFVFCGTQNTHRYLFEEWIALQLILFNRRTKRSIVKSEKKKLHTFLSLCKVRITTENCCVELNVDDAIFVNSFLFTSYNSQQWHLNILCGQLIIKPFCISNIKAVKYFGNIHVFPCFLFSNFNNFELLT